MIITILGIAAQDITVQNLFIIQNRNLLKVIITDIHLIIN